MGHIDHRAVVATRKLGPIEGFEWYGWECLDDGSVMLTGCVSSGVFTKGPRTGRPKFDGAPKRVVVTAGELSAERQRYEQETGHCAECGGDGQASAGWDHIKGSLWRPCSRCQATGKPVSVAAVDPSAEIPGTRSDARTEDLQP